MLKERPTVLLNLLLLQIYTYVPLIGHQKYQCSENKTAFCFNGIASPASWLCLINPFQDRGGGCKKASPISFSPVTSTNVDFGSQNFLTFSFNPFSTLVQNFKFAPSASPKLLNLNQDHPSKKAIFLVKSL